MLAELLTLNIFAFLLVFARFGTAFMLMPGFSAGYVSPRIRLTVALAITLVILPLVAGGLPPPPTSPAALGLLVAGEVLIGAFLGVLMQLVLTVLQTAGTIASLVASLANAFVQDPVAEQQSSILAGFLITVGLVLLFSVNGHHVMLQGAVNSYTTMVPGAAPATGDMANMLARTLANAFEAGVDIAAPMIVVGFTYYLGLGLLSRLQPQLPVFFVGLPIQVMVQISVLAITLSGMMLVFLEHFRRVVGPLAGL